MIDDAIYVLTNTKARAAEVLSTYMYTAAFHAHLAVFASPQRLYAPHKKAIIHCGYDGKKSFPTTKSYRTLYAHVSAGYYVCNPAYMCLYQFRTYLSSPA